MTPFGTPASRDNVLVMIPAPSGLRPGTSPPLSGWPARPSPEGRPERAERAALDSKPRTATHDGTLRQDVFGDISVVSALGPRSGGAGDAGQIFMDSAQGPGRFASALDPATNATPTWPAGTIAFDITCVPS